MENRERERNNVMPTEEIIFQVRINRETGEFDCVKTGLPAFEQMGFELFLQTYVKYNQERRFEDFYMEEVDEEDER